MHSVTRTPRQAGKLTGHKKTGGLWPPVPGLAALPSVGHGGEFTLGFLAYITTRFGSGCIVLHCLVSPPLLPGNIPQPQVSDSGGHHLRSEEHTSELQSRPHLVCRLLLEKKKK